MCSRKTLSEPRLAMGCSVAFHPLLVLLSILAGPVWVGEPQTSQLCSNGLEQRAQTHLCLLPSRSKEAVCPWIEQSWRWAFACSKEEALYGEGSGCNWAELSVSCFLLAWHLICSRDQVRMKLSIEAFAVAVSREASITYSRGFQKLFHKSMFEHRLGFVFPSPDAFRPLDIPFVWHFFRSENFWHSWCFYTSRKK